MYLKSYLFPYWFTLAILMHFISITVADPLSKGSKTGGPVLPQRCGDVISEPRGICKV